MIQAVNGWLKAGELGFCHSHEHLFIAPGQPARLNPALCIDNYSLTIQELARFKAIGGQAVVDAQPLGCGRMASALSAASHETGISIIASTGFHKLNMYVDDHWIRQLTAEQLFHLFVHELTTGMYEGSDRAQPEQWISAKAGMIKTAVDDSRMLDSDKRWFEAAAATAVSTGAPILCHVESVRQAEWLVQFYVDQGVMPAKIILCHLDRTLDEPQAHVDLAQFGVFLEYDTIGRFQYHSDEAEAAWIIAMLKAGIGQQILLGLDTTRSRLRSYGGTIGLDHLSCVFLPLLKQYGASDEEVRRLMVDNPGRALSFLT